MILQGDCLNKLKELPDNSIDAIVTDPPAGISFMNKSWDDDKGGRDNWIAWMQEIATECHRVLKPGGHGLVWSIPRTSHWTAMAWENAGFEIRDNISHVFGSGFPKSLNIGKAVDKLQGNEREDLGEHPQPASSAGDVMQTGLKSIARITKGTSEWEGWGTALKPAREDWWLIRKPIEKGLSIAENCLKWGVGGINIDGSRVGTDEDTSRPHYDKEGFNCYGKYNDYVSENHPQGRFPANLIHDGSEEVLELFPETAKSRPDLRDEDSSTGESGIYGKGYKRQPNLLNDSGSAARFFMTCKYTPNDAILKLCEDNLSVNNAEYNLPITSLIESVVKISSVLKNATPNLDLLNQNLNVLFAEKIPKNTAIDFVAKLVAMSEAPEGLVSHEELQVIQDFIINCKNFTQHQNNVSAEKLENIDITQITINLLKLCGYVLLATDENTNLERKEVGAVNGEPKRFLYCAKASKSERNMGLDSVVSILIQYNIWNENNTAQEEQKVQLLVDTDNLLQKVIGVFGTESKNATEWNTMLFGNCTLEKYKEVNKSTTEMKTNLITTSAICNWLRHLLINEYTADVTLLKENGGNLAENVEKENILTTTINEQMALALGVKNVVLGTPLKISVKEGSNFHSTVKPIKLMEYLVNLVSKEGHTVLDPFAGSETTGIACKKLNRNFIGIERDEEYCKIAEARINAVWK